MGILKNNCCFCCFLRDASFCAVLRRCYYETPVPPKLNDASYITTRNDIPWKLCTGCKVLLIFAILWFGIKTFANSKTCEELVNEALENVGKDYRYYQVYRRKLPKTLKYILLWNYNSWWISFYHGEGQRTFLKCNCSIINCFITTEKNYFGGDTTKFDAIAFHSANLKSQDLPKQKGAHQIYINIIAESADNFLICDEKFDNVFNWICSYRLDLNLYCGYFHIKNKYGEIVGPKRDMEWVDMSIIDEQLPYMHNKSKAAAWMVSHCKTRSKREEFVKNLQQALSRYGLTIDVFGACSTLKCPRSKECYNMLEKDYFFYLALENSYDEDYVTEKLLTAVNHNVIPIVYGGANYTRFLPPHSYLDGRQLAIEQLAATMAEVIRSKELYQRFFWWKRYYSYTHVADYCPSICSVCSALNNITLVSENGVYRQFRRTWNPNYKERCAEEREGFWNRFFWHKLLK